MLRTHGSDKAGPRPVVGSSNANEKGISGSVIHEPNSWVGKLGGHNMRDKANAYAGGDPLRKRLQAWDRNLQLSFNGRDHIQTEEGTTTDPVYHEDDLLSDPESVLSVGSISGRIKSNWDGGVSHDRWLYSNDRAVPFSSSSSIMGDTSGFQQLEMMGQALKREREWGIARMGKNTSGGEGRRSSFNSSGIQDHHNLKNLNSSTQPEPLAARFGPTKVGDSADHDGQDGSNNNNDWDDNHNDWNNSDWGDNSNWAAAKAPESPKKGGFGGFF